MWQFFQQNQYIIGALTGGLAAYLLGLLIGHLRREKRWLGYSREMQNIVRRGDPHLSIKYDQTAIERLDSNRVVLRNIGNRPLSNLPVRFDCGVTGKILEHHVAAPDGANFVNELDGNGSSLIVSVDLLNPGEAFTAEFIVADSDTDEVKVVARAENLVVKEIKGGGFSGEILDLLAESSVSAKVVSVLTKSLLRFSGF